MGWRDSQAAEWSLYSLKSQVSWVFAGKSKEGIPFQRVKA